jgi:hypothetical protein
MSRRKRRNRYEEASLMERVLPPIGKLVAWADAYFLILWGKILSGLDRFIDRGAVSGGLFIAAMFFGWVFVLKTVSSRPELNFTQSDTLRVGVALSLGIGALRFLCVHTIKRLGELPSKSSRAGAAYIQPFRPTAAAMLLAIGVYGVSRIGIYCHGVWYFDGYFYLTLTCASSLLGIYAHSAHIYLMIAGQLQSENLIKAKEIAGVATAK